MDSLSGNTLVPMKTQAMTTLCMGGGLAAALTFTLLAQRGSSPPGSPVTTPILTKPHAQMREAELLKASGPSFVASNSGSAPSVNPEPATANFDASALRTPSYEVPAAGAADLLDALIATTPRLEPGNAMELRRCFAEASTAVCERAKASRTVTATPDGLGRVYDFPSDARAAERARLKLAEAFHRHLPQGEAERWLAAFREAAEAEPSLDLFTHPRRISILPQDEGSGWKVVDRVYSHSGDLIAATTTYLGKDDDGELVWPEEHGLLLEQ